MSKETQLVFFFFQFFPIKTQKANFQWKYKKKKHFPKYRGPLEISPPTGNNGDYVQKENKNDTNWKKKFQETSV